MTISIVFVHKSISALPLPLLPVIVSTLFQVSPTMTLFKGAPLASNTVIKIVCIPLAHPLLRAKGHSRQEAIRKSMAGVGVSVGVGVGGMGVWVGVSVEVGVEVGLGVGLEVGVLAGEAVAMGVRVAVLVGEGANVGVKVRVGVSLGIGVGELA
jgi:hypothetical protein